MPPFDIADPSRINARGRSPARAGTLALIVTLTFVFGAGALPLAAQETAPATGLPAQTTGAAPVAPSPSAEPAPTTPTPAPAPAPAPANMPIASPQATAPLSQPASEEAPASEETMLPAISGDARLPHDLSPLGMFMAADWVVKAVMLGLAFASLVTWTIWLAKVLELTSAKARARRALRRLEAAETLASVSEQGARRWARRGPVAALVEAAHAEVARSAGLAPSGVKERAVVALSRIEARAGRRMARGTGLLATIGSTAPFVGLFGTVWGIMNAFIGISQANTTNLAVVAPGIAEALLATAIGLVAAIPAVIVYNVFSRSIAGYRALLSDASAEVLRHLSRDLDRQQRGLSPQPAE